ncbi:MULTISPECIES: rod-binding protein [Aeromonas]|jgi:flagellar protein FlgJ|uniref:Peptidoglycan hydrolase n=2 Tax=Aeromonas TaxID=642 RepID=A0A0T6N717_AERVE|nr:MULTISPECIES: rod-binding protein [Aeromonas]HDN9001552.1 rod-binding protein [Aeromonas veronii AMC24]AMQ41455.1 peptidoglycan hydrolase [Aeromonas veronii]ANB67571.1 peptidoglycan hydrolase [Aeromonas veronii]ATY82732.1 peptidoglycan hydrolase [Aeromonas veronii]EKP0293663.1 rod-binding protein [Aeromonas veronii]
MTRISSDPGFYQDLNELQQIKSNPDQRAALDAAAGQFEVSFLQTVLKHMRSATDALQDEDDKIIKGQSLYRDMYDSQLAMSMVKRGGIGLREQMVNQLAPSLKNPDGVVASEQQTLAAFSQPLNSVKMKKVD